MLKLLSDWGFTRKGWLKGERGEYLVLLQGLLLVGLIILPVYRPPGLSNDSSIWLYCRWGIALLFGLMALGLVIKGLLDLGNSLTPLPYPKEDGQLVQVGIYGLVRHPLYSGLIFAALSWVIFQASLSHLLATLVLFAFFNAKASREETWLSKKYPEYLDYQERVKRFIPGIY